MDLGLTGKRAAITNAAHGIGRAVAARLVAEGCHVSISDADADAVEHAKRALSREGVIVTGGYVRPDDAAGHADWIAATLDQLETLDLLVEATPAETQHGQGIVDLTVAIRAVEAAFPHLTRSRGALVLISPPEPLHAHGGHYHVAHHALAGYAASLRGKGVRIHTLCPGPVYQGGQPWSGEGVQPIQPEALADLAVFLGSPAAALLDGLAVGAGC